MAAAEPYTRRIVILGKTGSGKSSLANTILGTKVFNVNKSPNSGTKKCQSETKRVNGRKVRLIDTPGLFDTEQRSTELSPQALQCIIECAPGPHAFLLVLKVDKFTMQEQAVVDNIVKNFSEEALKYTTVVFTRGDDLPEGMKIEDWVSQNEDLNNLVQKCGGRCHVFDSKYWNKPEEKYRNNKVQVEELLKTIDTTVRENRGGYYTNELLMKIQNDLQREKARIRESEKLSEQSIGEKAKQNISNQYLTKLAGVSTGVLVGALLGGLAMISAVISILKVPIAIKAVKAVFASSPAGAAALTVTEIAAVTVTETAAVTVTETAAVTVTETAAGTSAVTAALVVVGAAAVVGGAVGGWIGYDAAEKAETPGEAAVKAGSTGRLESS